VFDLSKKKDILWNETFVESLWFERTIMHVSVMEFQKEEVNRIHFGAHKSCVYERCFDGLGLRNERFPIYHQE
jgi:hypothetical protein